MPKTKPIVSIENVVASATIDQDLNLDDIQKKFPKVEYNPESFPGAVFRMSNPKVQSKYCYPLKYYLLLLPIVLILRLEKRFYEY